MDHKVGQFYGLFVVFRASEVKVWQLMSIKLHNWSEIILTHISKIRGCTSTFQSKISQHDQKGFLSEKKTSTSD